MPNFDCGFCEAKHLLGRRGECQPQNNTCECPDGFSGKDDWLTFSGCQVNENVQSFLHKLLATLGVLGLVISIICFVWLSKRWRFRLCVKKNKSMLRLSHHLKSDESDSSGNDLSLFSPPKLPPNSSVHDQSLRNWRRKVFTLYSVLAYCVFFTGGIMYFGSICTGNNREDQPEMLGISLFILMSGGLPAGSLVILVWFYSIPDVAKYGRMLKMNWFLVRYPEFIPRFLLWTNIILQSTYFVLAVLIPLTQTDFDVLFFADQLLIISLVLIVIIYMVTFALIMNTVENIFKKAIKTFEKNTSGLFVSEARRHDVKFMKKSMVPLRVMKYICLVDLLLNLVLHVLNLMNGSSLIYVLLNLTFLMYSVFMLCAPICFVLIESNMAPKASRKPNDSESRQEDTNQI